MKAVLAYFVLTALSLLACSSNGTPAQSGNGGASGSGGTTSSGGGTGTGGGSSLGGSANTGGATVVGGGGNPGKGGMVSSGGVTGNGGGAGGVTGPGGAIGTGGGAVSSGGAGGVNVGSGGGTGNGGRTGTGGGAGTGGMSGAGGGTGGASPSGGGSGGRGGASGPVGGSGSGGSTGPGGSTGGAAFPFPLNFKGKYCILPTSYDNEKVREAYKDWKATTVTSEGAGGFLRVKKPDSGTVIGSTVSEGIGYGMILAVYMEDQPVFDGLWKYEQSHLDGNGLMNWEIGPDNKTTSGGGGAATDGDEDMAWALVMADRQWGGKGTLDDTYLNHAKKLIDLIWKYEVDVNRGYLLKPGDQWGDVDVTNPSYFAPAYFRVFGQVSGKADDWSKVVAGNYDILEKSLNATSGNASNGLVPAWCNSAGAPVEAYSGAPKYFQNDSTRTPFRVGQDYCYFGEPRAKSYLGKITSFYVGVGVANIVDGYELNGTPKPDKATGGAQAASFVGPAGVGAMSDSDAKSQSFLDAAYAAVATLNLKAGTIYYQKSWTALSLLMLTGSLADLTQGPIK
jgi:endo-1,4-beta-D-glucanase Y